MTLLRFPSVTVYRYYLSKFKALVISVSRKSAIILEVEFTNPRGTVNVEFTNPRGTVNVEFENIKVI